MGVTQLINTAAVAGFAVRYFAGPRRIHSLNRAFIPHLADILGNNENGKRMVKDVYHYTRALTIGLFEYLRLTGRKADDKSLETAWWIMAANPIYDSFFDTVPIAAEQISRLEQILNGSPVSHEQPLEMAMRYALNQVQQRLDMIENDSLKRYLAAIHNAQKAELEARLNPEKGLMKKTTSDKGGYAALLGFTPFFHGTIETAEEKAIYEFGSFSQLVDDMRDAEEDAAAGRLTLITEQFLTDEEVYKEQGRMIDALKSMNFSPARTHRFLLIHQLYFLSGLMAKHRYDSKRDAGETLSAFPEYLIAAREVLRFT